MTMVGRVPHLGAQIAQRMLPWAPSSLLDPEPFGKHTFWQYLPAAPSLPRLSLPFPLPPVSQFSPLLPAEGGDGGTEGAKGPCEWKG